MGYSLDEFNDGLCGDNFAKWIKIDNILQASLIISQHITRMLTTIV
jgi:hypothetical protein